MAKFFGDLFAEKQKVPNPKRGRTEPRHYGEALTEEEVIERIREEEEIKKQKREKNTGKGKKTTKRSRKETEKRDENMCQGCGGHYESDDEEIQQT